jgi:outer membrane protein assembly factor BamD
MPSFIFRRPVLPFWVAAMLVICSAPRLAADLTWTRQTGWQVEEGAASGLTGARGKGGLELMNKARIEEEEGSIGSAIGDYNKVAKKYQGSVFAPEALYRSGKLYVRRKQYYKGFANFQNILSRYPNTKRFDEIVGEEYRIASALVDGAHNHIFGGLIPSFSNRSMGITYFEIVLIDAPYSDYAPLALMDIARAHQYIKDTEDAIDALDRLVNTYPQSVLAPVAYLKLGDLHASLSDGPMYDQASTKEAMTYYEDYMILYPGDNNIAAAAAGVDKMKTVLARSKIYIGDFYFYKRQNYRAARVLYNEAITAYPESAPANLAKRRLIEVDASMARAAVGAPAPKKRFWLF